MRWRNNEEMHQVCRRAFCDQHVRRSAVGAVAGFRPGTVKDQQGKPIAGAIVVLLNLANGRKYELKTNAKGEYSSIGVAIGTYKATLIQNGNDRC